MNVKRIFDISEKILIAFLTIFFAIMVISLTSQIIARFIFSTAIAWAEELTRYSFVWLSMLGGSIAVRRGSHMRVDFFIERMPKLLSKGAYIVTNVLLVFFFIIMIKYGFDLVLITFKQRAAALPIPMAIPYISILVGGFFMLAYTLENIFVNGLNMLTDK